MANMTVKRLHQLFEENSDADSLAWKGTCHECNCNVEVTATPREDGIYIEGGGVYEPEMNRFFLKCDACYGQDTTLNNYQPCEVYSRVVGYLRPVAQWNDAKQNEFNDRKLFDSGVV